MGPLTATEQLEKAVEKFKRMLDEEYQTHPDLLSRLGKIYRAALERGVGHSKMTLRGQSYLVRRYPGELLYLAFSAYTFPLRVLVKLRREFPQASYDLKTQPGFVQFGVPDVLAIPLLARARELIAESKDPKVAARADLLLASVDAIESDFAATDFVSGFMDPYTSLFLRAGAPRMLVDLAFAVLYAEAEAAGAGFRLETLKRAYAKTLLKLKTEHGGPHLEPTDSLFTGGSDGREG